MVQDSGKINYSTLKNHKNAITLEEKVQFNIQTSLSQGATPKHDLKSEITSGNSTAEQEMMEK